MKTYSFPYYISFGKLDSVSLSIECSLSEKDAKRLERSAKEGGRFRLGEDEEIRDLYDKVLTIILKKEKDALLSDPAAVADALSWKKSWNPSDPITEEQIDNYLDELVIGINYPEELQFLEKTITKKVVQSNPETVVADRDNVQEYLCSNKENLEKIIYVDSGGTLYHIPKNFSGTFTISDKTKKIEKKAFWEHKKITEIIIEPGLQELPEQAFDRCIRLTHVVIPGTVKKIGYNTFTGCESLQKVDMQEGILEIDSTAFRLCTKLKEIRLPATVKSINRLINSYWNGIEHIYFDGMETTVEDKAGGDWRVTMHVKAESCAEKYARENNIKYVIES